MQSALFDFISQYITLSPPEKEAMIDLDLFKTASKGSILLQEGQISKQSYFVLKGCIRVYYVIEGEEKTTAFYTEMQGVTPNCVLTGSASEYYVACVEDSILAVSDPSMEDEIFEKFPKFETMCRLLSDELLAEQKVSLDSFKTSSPEQRYLKMLAKRPDLIRRVPQYQLASYLGITPQSLSRLRGRLTEKKK